MPFRTKREWGSAKGCAALGTQRDCSIGQTTHRSRQLRGSRRGPTPPGSLTSYLGSRCACRWVNERLRTQQPARASPGSVDANAVPFSRINSRSSRRDDRIAYTHLEA